jgi:hypothetical protein
LSQQLRAVLLLSAQSSAALDPAHALPWRPTIVVLSQLALFKSQDTTGFMPVESQFQPTIAFLSEVARLRRAGPSEGSTGSEKLKYHRHEAGGVLLSLR